LTIREGSSGGIISCGDEAGSGPASLAACLRTLATLSASPERVAWLEWNDHEREIGSALRCWREEAEGTGPTLEAGPAPVEVRGVDDIKEGLESQDRGQRGGGERERSQTTSMTFQKLKLSQQR